MCSGIEGVRAWSSRSVLSGSFSLPRLEETRETHADMLWLVHHHDSDSRRLRAFAVSSSICRNLLQLPWEVLCQTKPPMYAYHRLVETSIKWYHLSWNHFSSCGSSIESQNSFQWFPSFCHLICSQATSSPMSWTRKSLTSLRAHWFLKGTRLAFESSSSWS